MTDIAFVFPGQGSQSMGMLSDLAERYTTVRSLFSSVSERLGYDLWALTQTGPEETLNETTYTQAAMLTADVAVYHVIQSAMPIQAKQMAGHSLGEYAALVCAGALALPDAAALVSKRGQMMQDAVPMGVGAMAAIVGLPDDTVASICKAVSTADTEVMPANFNAIGQVVIAGHTEAVERAIGAAEEADARLARMIPVSVPCHCKLLEGMAASFSDALAATDFQMPSIPVISNVDAQAYQSVEQIRQQLASQLYQPVRWVETIQHMQKDGIQHIIECGPGKVLTGLTKRIDRSLQTSQVNNCDSLDKTLDTLKELS